MYIHTAATKREARTANGDGTFTSALATNLSSVACLVEPLSTRSRESIIGRIPSARYRLTWGTDDIQNGDTVIWNGSQYIIGEIINDTLRFDTPYQTGILSNVPGR